MSRKLKVGDLVWHLADRTRDNDKKDIGEIVGFSRQTWGGQEIDFVHVQWRSQPEGTRTEYGHPDVNIKPVTWSC